MELGQRVKAVKDLFFAEGNIYIGKEQHGTIIDVVGKPKRIAEQYWSGTTVWFDDGVEFPCNISEIELI